MKVSTEPSLCVAVTVYVVLVKVVLTMPVISPVVELLVKLPGKAGETVQVVVPLVRSIAVDEGALVSVLFPPSPNYPWVSDPQHFMSPLSRIAQVCPEAVASLLLA